MDNEYKLNNKNNYQLVTKSPGKVLMCGGYLIINPKYQGLVITTKTYFESRGSLEIKDDSQTTILIQINSKNFNQTFYYKTDISFDKIEKEDFDIVITFERINENDFKGKLDRKFKTQVNYNTNNENSNDDYIINTIKSAFYNLLLHQINLLNYEELITKFRNKVMFMKIDLDADYRFYGYKKDSEQNNIAKNIKTGLGSSSALVSSLTSNIILNFCQYLNNIEIKSSLNECDDKLKLCLLLAANNANNQAQKKV